MTSRAAHDSIRGYFAQTVRATLEWLSLGPNELLVIEGDEDHDRKLLQGGVLVETALHQHKDVASAVGWDKDVQRSVLGFVASYSRHAALGVRCKLMYATTSRMAAVEVMERWSTWAVLDPADRAALVAQVSRTLRDHPLLGEDTEFGRSARAGVRYLEEVSGRWAAFIEATEWEFGVASAAENLRKIALALGQRADASALPASDLAGRIVIAALTTATHPTVPTRTLTAAGLAALIASQKADLSAWASGGEARTFFTALDLEILLEKSRLKIDDEYRRGTLDQQGGLRVPRSRVEAELAKDSSRVVVVGKRGSGKTSAVAVWARARVLDDKPVAWVTCRNAGGSLDEFLQKQGLRLGAALLPVLASRNVALVVDALDQGRGPEAREMLVELVEQASGAGVRTVAIVRAADAEADPNVRRLLSSATRVDVGEFEPAEMQMLAAQSTEIDPITAAWTALPEGVVKLARLPLHAHLLWEVANAQGGQVSLAQITSVTDLMDRYWNNVVCVDHREIESANDVLHELTKRMVAAKRLTATLNGIPEEKVRRLVRAEVLRHPQVPSFGIVPTEVSFAYDLVFDYAVFRLLWLSATEAEVVASIASCGPFAVGLHESYRYLIEFENAARGPASAVRFACAVHGAAEIEEIVRERLATEFAAWVMEGRERYVPLMNERSTAAGRALLQHVAAARLGTD